jgi:cytoskeletal protein RodZ
MADIGSALREARMRDRIDISEVEAQTKIRAKYLRAIENEEFDLLPGPVYAKSFLRTYGDYLGLDSRMLLDEFRRRYEHPSEHDVRPIGSIASRERERREPRERRERRPRAPRMPSWLPIAAVVVVILVILGVVGSLSPSSSSTSSHKPRRHPHTHVVAKRSKKPTTTIPVVPTNATLQLTPTSTVYVCLVNGAGVKLLNERTFTVGETIPSETAPKLLLTLGNASVQMKANGKAYTVTPSPTAIRLLITPTGVTHILNSQTPTCP